MDNTDVPRSTPRSHCGAVRSPVGLWGMYLTLHPMEYINCTDKKKRHNLYVVLGVMAALFILAELVL